MGRHRLLDKNNDYIDVRTVLAVDIGESYTNDRSATEQYDFEKLKTSCVVTMEMARRVPNLTRPSFGR
jgi:hypothetical protein